jgi:hypothetical protein
MALFGMKSNHLILRILRWDIMWKACTRRLSALRNVHVSDPELGMNMTTSYFWDN